MLKARLLYGALIIALWIGILVGDLWFAPYYPLFAFAVIIVVALAAGELCDLVKRLPQFGEINVGFVRAATVVLVAANWWTPIRSDAIPELSGMRLVMGTFVGLVLLLFLITAWRFEKPGNSVFAVAASLLVLVYIGLLGSYVVQVRWHEDDPKIGLFAFLLMVFTAKCCDIGAYFTGRYMGKHKMAPILSPNKTWEGAVGGVLFSTLFAVSLTWFCASTLAIHLLSPPAAVAFGIIISITAMLGDLIESMIKRDSETKDAANFVPGFGGLLDIIDSVLFAGPVAYVLLKVLS